MAGAIVGSVFKSDRFAYRPMTRDQIAKAQELAS